MEDEDKRSLIRNMVDDYLADQPVLPDLPSEFRYSITRFHAKGGMGAVYEGYDRRLNRKVAIKTFYRARRENVVADNETLRREAKRLASFGHPSIVPVYDLIELPNREETFFVMKFIEGVTFSELLGKPSPEESREQTLAVFATICDAIAEAHHRPQPTLHLDLKPTNVMVVNYAQVYVLDWGIGRTLESDYITDEDDTASNCQNVSSPKTRTKDGTIKGTPGYMSPEQLSGGTKHIGTQSDVFSLGAMLTMILIGKTPYSINNPTEIKNQISDTFQELEDSNNDFEIVQLAKRCIDFDPKKRPENARVLLDEFRNCRREIEERLRLAESETKALTIRQNERRKRRKWIASTSIAGALLLIGMITVYNKNQLNQQMLDRGLISRAHSILLNSNLLSDQGKFDEAMKKTELVQKELNQVSDNSTAAIDYVAALAEWHSSVGRISARKIARTPDRASKEVLANEAYDRFLVAANLVSRFSEENLREAKIRYYASAASVVRFRDKQDLKSLTANIRKELETGSLSDDFRAALAEVVAINFRNEFLDNSRLTEMHKHSLELQKSTMSIRERLWQKNPNEETCFKLAATKHNVGLIYQDWAVEPLLGKSNVEKKAAQKKARKSWLEGLALLKSGAAKFKRSEQMAMLESDVLRSLAFESLDSNNLLGFFNYTKSSVLAQPLDGKANWLGACHIGILLTEIREKKIDFPVRTVTLELLGLNYLETALDLDFAELNKLQIDPDLDSFRSLPRFQKLLESKMR